MKRVLFAFALAAGLGATAPAMAGPLEDQFFAMDTSRDGSVSREEFVTFQVREGATERQANFAFDNTAGDDSRVSLNEFRNGPVARTQRRSSTRRTAQPAQQRRSSAPRRSSGGFSGGGGGS